MPGKTPTLEGTVLLQLRRQSGWTQARLERTARLSRGTLSLYETGKRSLGRPLLNRLAVTLGHSIEDVDRALAPLAQSPVPDAPPALTPASLLPHEHRVVEAAAERAAARVRLGVGTRLIEARLSSERLEAANLWEQLRRLPTLRACRERIDADSRFRSWALSERLCDESVDAAARDVGTSLGLAKLALKVAEVIPGHDAWQCRVQGYAWAFVANSFRIGGDLLPSEQASRRSSEFWIGGAPSDPAPLDESQIVAVIGRLRVEQERFDEAQTLYDTAIRQAVSRKTRARMSAGLAFFYGRQNAHEKALEMLECTRSWIAETDHPHLHFALAHNRALSLVNIGNTKEALKELDRARRWALCLGELRVLLVDWLSAIFFARSGRDTEAVKLFAKVRRAYVGRNMMHQVRLVEKDVLAELRMPLGALTLGASEP